MARSSSPTPRRCQTQCGLCKRWNGWYTLRDHSNNARLTPLTANHMVFTADRNLNHHVVLFFSDLRDIQQRQCGVRFNLTLVWDHVSSWKLRNNLNSDVFTARTHSQLTSRRLCLRVFGPEVGGCMKIKHYYHNSSCFSEFQAWTWSLFAQKWMKTTLEVDKKA